MASAKQYEFHFMMDAQVNGGFNNAFKKAQEEFTRLGNEVKSLNKVQSDISAYQKHQAALEKTSAKLENMRQKMANIAQQKGFLTQQIEETKAAGKSTTALERELAKLEMEELRLSQSVNDSENALEKRNLKLDATSEKLAKAGVSTADLAVESAKLGARIDELKQQQEEAARSAQEFGESGTNAFTAIKNAMKGIAAAAAVKATVSYLRDCATAAIEYETAMAGVRRTVGGTSEEIAVLSTEFIEMSMVIPIAATELAAIATTAGQLGVAQENVSEFTEVMAMLATTTDLTSDSAATMLAQFANITGTTDYQRLGSTVADLGDATATTASKVVEMSQGMAAAGNQAGLSETDILGISAAVGSLGIEAQAGSTAMSTLIQTLYKAVETGDNLMDFASVAGMSASQFRTAWGTNAAGALSAFIKGLNDTERNGKSAIVILDNLGITNTRQTKAILGLASAGDLLTDTIAQANTAWEENTALAEKAGIMYETTESQIILMKNALTNLGVTVGDVLTPAMRVGAEAITSMATGAADNIAAIRNALSGSGTLAEQFSALRSGIGNTQDVAELYAEYHELTDSIENAALTSDELADAEARLVEVKALLIESAGGLITATEDENDALADQLELYENINAAMLAQTRAEMADNIANSVKDYAAAVNAADNFYNRLAEAEEHQRTLTAAWNDGQTHQERVDAIYSAYNDLQELAGKTVKIGGVEWDYFDTSEGAAYLQSQLAAIADTIELFTGERIDFSGLADVADYLDGADLSVSEFTSEIELAASEVTALQNACNDAETSQMDWLNNAVDAVELGALSFEQLKEIIEGSGLSAEDAAEAITYVEDALNGVTDAASESEEALDGLGDSASYTQAELEQLAAKYEAVYNSAYESISGQIGLFETMSVETETSIDAMIAALESQVGYMAEYSANLKAAADLGLDETLLAQLSDGSVESAAYLQAIVKDGGNRINELNAEFAKVSEGKEEFSETVAEMKTGLDESMAEMVQIVEEGVSDMDLGPQASQSARSTVGSFITTANSMTSQVSAVFSRLGQTAINGLNSGLNSTALNTGRFRTSLVGLTGAFASGTDYAPRGLALVGEAGPELVMLQGGERIFPADETARMLDGSQLTAVSPMLLSAITRYSEAASEIVYGAQRAAEAAAYPEASEGGGNYYSADTSKVEVHFHIEGNATQETVEQLNLYGLEFAERVVEIVQEHSADVRRRSYRQ